MSWFRRRAGQGSQPAGQDAPEGTDGEAVGAVDEVNEVDEPLSDDAAPARSGLSPRPNGPWDESERPDPEGYVDLGSLRLRGREGMELRLEVEEATGNVTSATIQLAQSAVQLQAFAAPRSEGIWDEIRAEIAAGITRQGGTAQDLQGVFGTELRARIPVRTPDGRSGYQPARFAGVNGPRWFLRAVFHGEAVEDPLAAADLEAVVRDVVIVRGAEAMAPRELLPLKLPDVGATPGAGEGTAEADAAGDAAGQRPPLDPFERGPEITEIR